MSRKSLTIWREIENMRGKKSDEEDPQTVQKLTVRILKGRE